MLGDIVHAPDTRATTDPIPPPEPLLLAARQAAALCGVSLATWHRLRSAGRIGPAPVRLGGRVLWRRAELAAWIEANCPDSRTWTAMQAARRNGRHR
jgi:predicted DNA-binding transcriptional regulator AlpA